MTNGEIARTITQLRLAAGLTQRELCAKTGITQATISAIELEKTDPKISTVSILLGCFGYELTARKKVNNGRI